MSSDSVNGKIVLGGVEALGEPRSPVVGPRRARISRPLAVPPTSRGRWGSAWLVDLPAIRRKLAAGMPADAMLAHWVIEAPWSSEVVHSYSLVLIHLRFSPHHAPVVRYVDGATHEVALLAISPQADREVMLTQPSPADAWLRPAVFGAQLVSASDEAAVRKAGQVVDLVCQGRLSPHPTHARAWAEILGDNMMRRAEI